MVSIGWYLGSLKGQLGGAGGEPPSVFSSVRPGTYVAFPTKGTVIIEVESSLQVHEMISDFVCRECFSVLSPWLWVHAGWSRHCAQRTHRRIYDSGACV